jgi:chromosome segregation ATPase
LNNNCERQKGEYHKIVGRHTEYERQINSLKTEIDTLNKNIQSIEAEKNDLTLKINELKIERKNLMEYTKRGSTSFNVEDSGVIGNKSNLLAQLA